MEWLKVNPPGFLLVATTIGFFVFVFMLFFKAFPLESKDILNVMLGVISTAWSGMVGYYFGSSQGSAVKTALISGKKDSE